MEYSGLVSLKMRKRTETTDMVATKETHRGSGKGEGAAFECLVCDIVLSVDTGRKAVRVVTS